MPLKYKGKDTEFPLPNCDEIYPSKCEKCYVDKTSDKHRSPATKGLLLKDLKEFSNETVRPTNKVFDFAIGETIVKFSLYPTNTARIQMLHICDFCELDLGIWSKSAGWPWIKYGIRTIMEIRDDPERVREVRKFWHYVKLKQEMQFPDCCAFVCAHDDKKIRAIWGYPATVTFGEAVFAKPLIDAYSQLPTNTSPFAYGMETVTDGPMKIRSRFIGNGLYYHSLKFLKFDKTVPAWLIDIAFDILMFNIDFVHFKGYGVAYAHKMLHMFNTIKDYFINTPIRTAKGLRFKKSSGIPSGSYFSQLISSIVNCIALTYAVLKITYQLPFNSVFLGDESFLTTTVPLDLSEVSKILLNLGLIFNEKKSMSSTNIDELNFLGYQIKNGLAKKNQDDLVASLNTPEHPDESGNEAASRT